jgi:hypothetical protein
MRVETGGNFGEWWPLLDISAGRWSGVGSAVAKIASKSLTMAWRGAAHRLLQHMKVALR